MAKAVATLEGDSSSLVKAINDAKGSMTKLESEGKKLTDQLRDVADSADVAAGKLVNKIGGPTAIKAIAGVGAAFAGAGVALDALSNSMNAFYATQGDEGAKAMADIDKALNTLASTLFTAVMGTDDMEEITRTLISGIETLTAVVDVLLIPLRFLGDILKLLRDFANENADATRKQNDELIKLQATQALMKKSYDSNQTAIEGNLKAVRALTGATEDGRKASLRAALTATDAIAAQVMLAEKEQDIADYKRLANADEADNERRARETASAQLAQGLIQADEFEAASNRFFNNMQNASRKAALATVMVMSDATKTQLQSLGAQRQVLAAELLGVTNQMKTEAEGVTNTPTNTPTSRTAPAGGKGDRAALIASLDEEAKIRADALIAQLEAERQLVLQYGDPRKNLTDSAAVVEAQANKDRLDAKQAEALVRLKETEAAEKARIAATAEFEKQFDDAKKARDDAKAAEEKAAHDEKVNQLTAGFQEYGKLAGQQLAEGEKASKVAEKLAKKALGGQISALGDKAMVEAAIYAAAFNPMAIPMAAAGLAAYTAAAYLGAEGKKATTATRASATPAAQSGPVNTAFNLRVDAAFADGESIARQFAMMQRSAQRRGLVTAGA
jgi:hypothetical protein